MLVQHFQFSALISDLLSQNIGYDSLELDTLVSRGVPVHPTPIPGRRPCTMNGKEILTRLYLINDFSSWWAPLT